MDYTPILNRIAESAEKIALTPNCYWLQATIPIISVIIGAAIGYFVSQSAIKQQVQITKTNQNIKKRLVFDLLKDEIKLRWDDHIKVELLTICELENLKRLRHFSTARLREDDLFIFRDISLSFKDYYFLENNELISKIIHGFLLYKNLIDFNKTVNRFLVEYERNKKRPETYPEQVESDMKKNEIKIIAELSSGLKEKIIEIDRRFNLILGKIEI